MKSLYLILAIILALLGVDAFAIQSDSLILTNNSQIFNARIENVSQLSTQTCGSDQKGELKFLTTQEGANLPGLYICDGSDWGQAGGGGGSTDLAPTMLSSTQVKINRTASEGSTSFFKGEKVILSSDTTLTVGSELSSAPGSNYIYDLIYWNHGASIVSVDTDIFAGAGAQKTEAEIDTQIVTDQNLSIRMTLAVVEIDSTGVTKVYRWRYDVSQHHPVYKFYQSVAPTPTEGDLYYNRTTKEYQGSADGSTFSTLGGDSSLKISRPETNKASVKEGYRWMFGLLEGEASDTEFTVDSDSSFVSPDDDELCTDGINTLKNYMYYDTYLNKPVSFCKDYASDNEQDDYGPNGSSRPDPRYVPLGWVEVNSSNVSSDHYNYPQQNWPGYVTDTTYNRWMLSSDDDVDADADGFVLKANVDSVYTHNLNLDPNAGLRCVAYVKSDANTLPQDCAGLSKDLTSTQIYTDVSVLSATDKIKYEVYYLGTGKTTKNNSWSTCDASEDISNDCWISNSEASFASDYTWTHNKTMDKPICSVWYRTNGGYPQLKSRASALKDFTTDSFKTISTWTSTLNTTTDEYYISCSTASDGTTFPDNAIFTDITVNNINSETINGVYDRSVCSSGCTDTTLASAVSNIATGQIILVKEDLIISAQIDLTKAFPYTIEFLNGKKLTCSTNIASSVIKFDDDILTKNMTLELTQTGTTVSGFEFNGSNSYHVNLKVIMNGTGTLTNAYILNSGEKGNIATGLAYEQAGTVTNTFTDNSGNAMNNITILGRD